MPLEQSSQKTAFSGTSQSDRTRSETAINQKQELKTTVEGWEQCLRKQIKAHPRIAIGMGLMVGLLAGWWVKR